MEALSDDIPRASSRLGEATAFYKSLADELTALSRRTAELTWTTDVAPRSHRSQNLARAVAPTGRLPASRAVRTQSNQGRPQERSSGISARPATVGTRRPTAVREQPSSAHFAFPPQPLAASVEVSTRKPIHLQEVKTRPEVVRSARRGAQPRSQLKGSIQVARARRLKLSEARTAVKPPPPPLLTMPDDHTFADRASADRSPRPLQEVALDAMEPPPGNVEGSPASLATSRDIGAQSTGHVMQQRPGSPGAGSVSSSVSMRASRQLHQQSSARPEIQGAHVSMFQDLDASATSFLCPNPVSEVVPIITDAVGTSRSEPAKARLASVSDLQLVLPETVTSHLQMISSRAASKTETTPDAKPAKEVSSSPPPVRKPPPMIRPVIRGLIADVIGEMRGPEFQPADVVGGVEIKPFIDPMRIRKSDAAPIDEDIFGRRIGKPPPPYEDSSPPPYDSPLNQRQHADSLKEQKDALARAQSQIQAQIQSQLQMISLSQAQVNSQRDEVSNLARLVQQQAEAAQSRLAQTVEQQTAMLQAVLQRGLAEVQRDTTHSEQQLAFTLQQSVSAAIASASQHHPPGPSPGSVPSQLDGQILPVMLDTLRRLEGNFQQQLAEVMRAQSEDRAAHISALRSLQQVQQQVPRTVQAVVPLTPLAARAPVHPVVSTTEVGAQASLDSSSASLADGEVQACLGPTEDYDARVTRFTDYLLHGPTGHREPPSNGLARPLTPWPLPSDLFEIDAMLAGALGGPIQMPVQSETSDVTSQEQTTSESGTMSHSRSEADDLSFGEVGGLLLASPGEVAPSEPSFGEAFSDVSPGELPVHPEQFLDASSDSGHVFGHSAGEVSGVSSDLPSVGQVASSCSSNARFGRREPGEMSAEISSPLASEGEAVDAADGLMSGEASSGELFAPSFGEVVPSSIASQSGSALSHSPGSLASSGLVPPAVLEPEPYLSPRGV